MNVSDALETMRAALVEKFPDLVVVSDHLDANGPFFYVRLDALGGVLLVEPAPGAIEFRYTTSYEDGWHSCGSVPIASLGGS